MEDCLQWKGSHTGVGEEFEEKGVAEKACDELTTVPIFHVPAQSGVGKKNQE